MIRKKIIGRLPQNDGNYDSSKTYGKKKRCFLYGCEWESKIEGNTYAPATLNTTTGVITPDTAHWFHCSGSYNDWLIDNGYKKVDAGNVKDGDNTQHDINAAVAAGLNDRYTKSKTYTKAEVNALITTPDQGFDSVEATSSTTSVTDVLPATGEPDTIYRVGNWDGMQYDDTVYSEYAWDGTNYVHLSKKTQIGEVFDISSYHATGGTLQTYSDLADALGTNGANVPEGARKGGMSIKFVQTSDNKYVQFRYMSSSTAVVDFTNVANWQGVDDEPTVGSDNLAKSGGVYLSALSPVVDTVNSTISSKLSFIKEFYIEDNAVDKTHVFGITDVARNKNGVWFIRLKDITSNVNYDHLSKNVEPSGIVTFYSGKVFAVLDWTAIPENTQVNPYIKFNNKVFDNSYSPSISAYLLSKTNDGELQATLKSYIDNADNVLDKKLNRFADSNLSKIEGKYVSTNKTDGGTPYDLVIGQKIVIREHQSFNMLKVKVFKGLEVYLRKVDYTSLTTANPIIVDINDILLAIGDSISATSFTYDGKAYWKYTIPVSGYLIVSLNERNIIYSEYSNVHNGAGINEAEKNSIKQFLGLSGGITIPFDYNQAVSMDRGLLRAMVESASCGKCTVLHDTNGYPSLMYKIPINTIGAFDSRLGTEQDVHPAFFVDGVKKDYIYCAVFMSSLYNNVPVSWFGLPPMSRVGLADTQSLISAKGEGWHLETIWERSLISLLSAKKWGGKPRGNNDKGRSSVNKYEVVQSYSGAIPGSAPNSDPWINGTEPVEWSHNGMDWGIYDIIGGYHEFLDLVRIVNGQIVICADNNFGANISDWLETGCYLTIEGTLEQNEDPNTYAPIAFSNSRGEATEDWAYRYWNKIQCLQGYDSLSDSIRKKLALSLIVPRLSSSDNEPLFNFDGSVSAKNNVQSGIFFMGGALEYKNSGLAKYYCGYPDTENHGNMGNRIFYID